MDTYGNYFRSIHCLGYNEVGDMKIIRKPYQATWVMDGAIGHANFHTSGQCLRWLDKAYCSTTDPDSFDWAVFRGDRLYKTGSDRPEKDWDNG